MSSVISLQCPSFIWPWRWVYLPSSLHTSYTVPVTVITPLQMCHQYLCHLSSLCSVPRQPGDGTGYICGVLCTHLTQLLYQSWQSDHPGKDSAGKDGSTSHIWHHLDQVCWCCGAGVCTYTNLRGESSVHCWAHSCLMW